MYSSMKNMLKKANEENYAILAINAFNLETCKAVIEAAEENHAPIIIDLLQEHLQHHIDFRYMADGLIQMCQEAKVEVAINLDHGKDVPHVKQMLQQGMKSVMIDASGESIEENIRTTKEIVSLAECFAASVEAELGKMGSVAQENWTTEEMYTNPQEAIDFIQQTGVDCLAISFGTTHGEYPEGYIPKFRFDIVEEIKRSTSLPLVLHGGSGAGEENIRKSVQAGINKINVGTDVMNAQREYVRKAIEENPLIEYPTLIHGTIQAAKEEIKRYLEISGSINKS
ncbi:fructose-bisphosphate aldolase, class II [Pilibacter termitis]|uniref:Fructose-bisphosphate aldolase, class II n=1 Tax=Pilibacter termitis TaxID=263852 RepID=A0A1T4REF1_9ENTE|nr:class II fructose-bisphosphate aldolase [Pilibacter termitis]SKA14289.1 fructose-bisphosphate aldolase, class II [Pilibacter termitis]